MYLCHQQPDLLVHDATVVGTEPGRVMLSRSAMHPGGGGQQSDLGSIEHSGGLARVVAISADEQGRTWHHLDNEEPVEGIVVLSVDADRRSVLAQLHTDSHILNAFVFDRFGGALVTGAQINADGTGRMDFDIPDADNDALRSLESAVNVTILRALDVHAIYLPVSDAIAKPELLRSQSVAPPPTDDGTYRIIDIDGIDRQACGGTHLANTAQSKPFRITKVENKGRHNRRVRFALAT